MLVAPASDLRKATKALESDADEVVLDLEDAVTPANKESARTAAVDLIGRYGDGRTASIRINGADSEWYTEDLAACATCGATLASVVVPKAQSATDLQRADAALGDSPTRLQALIETPVGVRDVGLLATATDRLDAFVIGYADLAAALGRRAAMRHDSWIVVQDAVLIAARAAGISAVDGPHLTIAADDDFRTAKTWVRDLGFDGTWVIHPAQLATATEIFTPDQASVDDARRVLDALAAGERSGAGAVELDGRMLDEALAVSARRILANAGQAL
ncbi:CoA ester lyase [Gordonia jinhuaensis]|uniref:Citrate lyase subunit beta n=1 Tax=Gordonia jinhuaensis TaxID=1517702 RepID=A0A916TCP3_9ACTN|nr:citrate lyase subunit beta [Gordonia jinhuaensis]